ncbi:DUF7268 family protein [Halorubrum amylolyticum]|uniref:DUF7268 family protein n=1 Tax=Halorubrum amylolyticum TaxID=2508724 RepID=UPI00100890BE|nr:hypothetical protein [Halorubrum amylolyticum]
MSLPPAVRERGRLVAGGAAVGAAATPVLLAGLVAIGGFGPLAAAETAFAFGGLWFGLALLGWAGSVASGRAIEAAQEHLDADSGWTERRSRRAMARIGGFGAGMMLVAPVVGTAVG